MENGKLKIKLFFLFLPIFLFASVKKELVKFYKHYYPNIEIVSIYTQKPFPKKYKKISFKLIDPKFPSGNLIIENKYYFYRIKAKLTVYKTIKVIKKNESVFPYVKKEKIDFRHFYSPPLLKITDDLIASKVISKNAVITQENTRIKPAVLQGDNVNVVFKGNGVVIYSKGTALNDANIGEKIKVKINHKIYEGVLNKSYEVEIQ